MISLSYPEGGIMKGGATAEGCNPIDRIILEDYHKVSIIIG